MSDTVVGAEVRLKIDKFLAALDQLPEAAGGPILMARSAILTWSESASAVE